MESEGQAVRQFSFSKGAITGSIYVEGNEELKPGTDYVGLTVNLNTGANSTAQ